MNKLMPKSLLDWIWLLGMLALIGLVIYTLATGTSPFQAWGWDPKTTTIIFGSTVAGLIVLYYITRAFKK